MSKPVLVVQKIVGDRQTSARAGVGNRETNAAVGCARKFWILAGLLTTLGAISTAGQTATNPPFRQFGVGYPRAAALSEDGAFLAIAGFGGLAGMDMATGEPAHWFWGHEAPVSRVMLSADGSRMLSSGDLGDPWLRLWDPRTGALLRAYPRAFGWTGYPSPYPAAFSRDGSRLATLDETGTMVETRDVDTGALLWRREMTFTRLLFSPDGTTLLAGGELTNHQVLMDAETGVTQRTFVLGEEGALDSTAFSMAFSADGSRLAFGSLTGAIQLWDVATTTLLRTLTAPIGAPTEAVDALAFSPDGSRVAATTWARWMYVWDAETAELTGTYPFTGQSMLALEWSGTDPLLISADETSFPASAPVHVRNLVAGETIQTFALETPKPETLGYGPGAFELLSAQGDEPVAWDLSKGEIVARFNGTASRITRILPLPQPARFLTGSEDGSVRRWNASTGEVEQTFTGHTGAITALACSSDGSRIATGSTDGTARVWDAATATEIASFGGHDNGVRSVDLSPGGGRLITTESGWNLALRGWDVNAEEPLWGYPLAAVEERSPAVSPTSSSGAVFSPNGELVLTSRGALLDGWTGIPICYIDEPHYSLHTAARFSPDGAYIAIGCGEAGYRGWVDLYAGDSLRPVGRLEGFTGRVTTTLFSEDGAFLLTTDEYGGAQLWATGLRATVASYGFISGEENWRFESTAEFDAPTPGVEPGIPGLLTLTAANNRSTFGYWESPLISLAPRDQVYTAEYFVRYAGADPAQAPQLRLRVTEDGGDESAFLAVESGATGAASPHAEGTSYTLPFTLDLPFPSAAAARAEKENAQIPFTTSARIAFDLLNFNPRDDPAGKLEIDSARLVRHDASDLAIGKTLLRSYTFENGAEGWTAHGAAPFDPPIFAAEGGALTATGIPVAHDFPNVFGYWSSPPGDIPHPAFSGKTLYIATFEVESTVPAADANRTPQFRVRLNDRSVPVGSVTAVESAGSAFRSPTAGNPGTYVVYYVAPTGSSGTADGADLVASFDYLNFDLQDDPLATLKLLRVDIEAIPYPWGE